MTIVFLPNNHQKKTCSERLAENIKDEKVVFIQK